MRQPGLEFGAIGCRDFDARGRDGFDGWLGESRNRKQKYARQPSHIGSHYPTGLDGARDPVVMLTLSYVKRSNNKLVDGLTKSGILPINMFEIYI
jgi:hypothetical protein